MTDGTNTNTYTYGDAQWQDKLTAYNGNTITYDAAGNPTTYHDGTTMTWTQGRRLASIKNGNTTVASYTYDMSGIRTSKTVGGTTYNYITQNGQVVRQTWGDNTLDIVYDNNNQPYYCVYTPDGGTATTYYYITNLQGDVVRLVNSSGTIVARYTYNAWGKLLSSSGSMASVNPIRYRGYYHDTETGFYYLQSRYYDPEICRFVNADSFIDTEDFLGYNLFVYCANNPVNHFDNDGRNAVSYVGNLSSAFQALSGVFAGIFAFTFVDGPLMFADVIAGAVAGVLALGVAGYSLYNTCCQTSQSLVDEDEQVRVIPDRNKPQAYFTENPYDFNPQGLVRQVYVAPNQGKNGGIIKWEIPGTKIAIFEWNQDYVFGSHYHIMDGTTNSHDGTHIPPRTPVPEPWNTLYFGGSAK